MLCSKCETTWNDDKLRCGKSSVMFAWEVDRLMLGKGCPECNDVLVAREDSQLTTCNHCGAEFEIPQNRIKYKGSRRFYFSPNDVEYLLSAIDKLICPNCESEEK